MRLRVGCGGFWLLDDLFPKITFRILGSDSEDREHTIFLTCSGVRGDLGRTPGLEGAVWGGGVDGLSVMVRTDGQMLLWKTMI